MFSRRCDPFLELNSSSLVVNKARAGIIIVLMPLPLIPLKTEESKKEEIFQKEIK